MNAERTKVLEMLATGAITIEQANQLIEALEAGSAPSAAQEGYRQSLREPSVYEGATIVFQKQGDVGGSEQAPGFQGSAGSAQFTLEQIVTLSENDVDPNFIKELWEAGMTDLTFEQIITLSEHDVDPDFLKRLRRAGVTDLTFEQIIALSEHEVDPDFIRRLREAGLTDLSFEQIVELNEREVDPALLKALRHSGAR